MVIGDRRKYLSALVWLEPDATKKFLTERGATGAPETHVDVRAEIQKAVDAANEKLARVEQVKKFVVCARPLGIDTGELTPTLKVKRAKVNTNFSADIESMYAGDSSE